MGIYLGSSKLKINVNKNSYRLLTSFPASVISSIRLLSSDNYILKDSNGTYLIAKEEK